MKKNLFTITILFALIVQFTYAQDYSVTPKGKDYCSQKKMNSNLIDLGYNILADIKHSFDVLDYKLNMDIYSCFISPYPKSFSCKEIITLKADSNITYIDLNAVNTSLTIDSVGLSGTSFTHSGNILRVNLNRTYTVGETLQVKINYRHNNVSDNAFYVSNGMVFTDAEPEGARKWFPCWDKPSDKATFDLTAKTPATVKLGSNGRLADSIRTGDTIYYHWVSRDPIATYLDVISAKVNYNLDIVYWHKISNPNDSIPMRFYSNAGENTASMRAVIIPMTTYYSQKFGEHPFEKNGFAALNNQFTWGGMENQTLTSICPNCWDENLISHEFAHQWFGDMITCATWADIFLNEGFATFSEALWYESSGGYTAYKNDINSDASGYLSSNPGWAISNPDWAINTPSTSVLFNTAVTYNKGACVLHMLRYLLGDTQFFNGLIAYATDPSLKYKSAVIPDFKNIMALYYQGAGSLDWFFNQWIYQPNHPTYQNGYWIRQIGSVWEVGFQAKQTQTNTVFFKMPIEIKISFTTGSDTLVKVMNDVNNQVFIFNFYRQPTAVQFDPNNNIVLKTASLSVISPIPVELTSFTADVKDGFVILKWNTATEINNKGFEIERAVGNLNNSGWTTVAYINGKGTTTNPNEYSYVDYIDKFGKYSYRLKQIDFDGKYSYSKEILVEAGLKPTDFVLHTNYPNPFNPETNIRFEIPKSSKVNLSVYNSLGQFVTTLVEGTFETGTYERTFNARNLASGIYFYVLRADNILLKQKMSLLK